MAATTDPSLLLLAGPSHVLNFHAEAGPSRPAPFLLLPHPRTGVPTYYITARSGSSGSDLPNIDEVYELQAVRNDKSSRSWFLNGSGSGEDSDHDPLKRGWVVQDGTLHILLPLDPAFLLLAILSQTATERYLSRDDIFEEAAASCYKRRVADEVARVSKTEIDSAQPATWTDILQFSQTRCATIALDSICDVQSSQDDTFYRLSPAKISSMLKRKVSRLVQEEQFETFPGTLGKALSRATEWNASDEEKSQARIDIAIDIVRGWIPLESQWEKSLQDIKADLSSHE